MAIKLPFITLTLEPPSGFVYDKRKECWKLLEEGRSVEGEPDLELAPFLQGEDYVSGHVMRARSLVMGGRTGQHHAERVIAQAEVVPAEWRQYFLVFPDTLWRSPHPNLYVPYLRWVGDRWELCFRCFDSRLWGGNLRIVRLREQLMS